MIKITKTVTLDANTLEEYEIVKQRIADLQQQHPEFKFHLDPVLKRVTAVVEIEKDTSSL